MTPLNCLTLKTQGCLVQESQLCLFSKPSYTYFCSKVHYQWRPSWKYAN